MLFRSFMGSELLMAHDLFLNDNAMIHKAQIVIDDMGMDLDVREKVKDLSIARQQMVEISRSLLSDAKLIVMDEPTSSLTENEIEQLFSQIRKLKSTGIAIIYISKRVDRWVTRMRVLPCRAEVRRSLRMASTPMSMELLGSSRMTISEFKNKTRAMIMAYLSEYTLSDISGKNGKNECLQFQPHSPAPEPYPVASSKSG